VPSCWSARTRRILDIGSGWGGLALYLADVASAKVTGITLSRELFEVSRPRQRATSVAAPIF